MKAASAPLIALFASGQPFLMADCYTITLISGAVYRYTSFDVDLTYGGTTWLAGGPVIERGPTRIVIGLEVGTMGFRVSPKDTDLLGSQTWFQAACAGALDGATVLLERAFMETVPSVVGTIKQNIGTIASLTVDRGTVETTCNAPTELLNIQMPRNLYQSGCQHTLFDAGCALSPASYAVTGVVASAPTRTSFGASLAQGAGYFDLGAVQFTSGALSGLKRTVKTWAGGVITLLNPTPVAPAVSDNFTLWPGCNRAQATCSSKFSNLVNFKGFPFVPAPETAL